MNRKSVRRHTYGLCSILLFLSLIGSIALVPVLPAHAQKGTAGNLTSFNLLMNPGFEEGNFAPQWWDRNAWVLPNSTFRWASIQRHSGAKSVVIENTADNDAMWVQTIAVQPNSNYLLSGWIRTKDVAHSSQSVDAGANLSVLGGFEHTQALVGTHDWTYVTLSFNSGSRTQVDIAARLGMYSGTTTGTAWFDDLALELTGTPTCYTLQTIIAPLGSGMVAVDPAPNCNNGTQYIHGTVVKLTATPGAGSPFGFWSGATSGTVNPAYVAVRGNGTVTANFVQPVVRSPQWKILVLIYPTTDFSYSDDSGQHHVLASMTADDIDRATAAATRFVQSDIPTLTSWNMIPTVTVRQPSHALSSLDPFCGYWPATANTAADWDPAFDSIIVIWDDSGTDLATGQPADLNSCGGLTPPNGTGQTYTTFPVDSVSSSQRNVFKHEWGHSLLFYFDATGLAPQPTVDNHIDDTNNPYVHCSSGTPYILQDETDLYPIPNSIYNNDSGFTHDYYSGATAKPDNPTHCLGITPAAWSSGGPVTKNIFSDVLTSHWAWAYIDRLYKAGITGGCSTNPMQYCPESTVTRAQMAVFLLRGIHGSSYSPPAVGDGTGFSDVPANYWAAAWIKQLAAEGITGGCGNVKFCPEVAVTRDQMAVFLLRSEHGSAYSPPAVGSGTGFGDVPPDYWAAAWIKQLVTEGITAGCGNGNYCPSIPVTRAQMAVFLVRTFNLP